MKYRLIRQSDYSALADYYSRNASHFQLWMPKASYDFHSRVQWKSRITDLLREQESGLAAYFVAEADGKIFGHCNLSQISRGVFQACFMGYGVCQNKQGQGVAFEMVTAALKFAAVEIKLNRVMANYMPHNNRSAKLLKRLGFAREGFARNYLMINGRWENHVLTAIHLPSAELLR